MTVPYGSAASELAQLREQVLGEVLFFAFAALYLWCLVLFPGGSLFGPIWLAPFVVCCSLGMVDSFGERAMVA